MLSMRHQLQAETVPVMLYDQQRAVVALQAQIVADTGQTISVVAGEAINGQRAVYIANDGRAYLADKTQAACRQTVGLSAGAAAIGALMTIQTDGIYTEPTWAWGLGPVWITTAGQLSQTVPTVDYLMQVGVPVGPTKLRIEPLLVAKV